MSIPGIAVQVTMSSFCSDRSILTCTLFLSPSQSPVLALSGSCPLPEHLRQTVTEHEDGPANLHRATHPYHASSHCSLYTHLV
jgi:hypothetical protein